MAQWEQWKLFKDEDAKLAVGVWRLALRDGNQYSLEIGSLTDEGRFARFIRPAIKQGEHGAVDWFPFDIEALNKLTARAEQAVYEEVQEVADRVMQRRIDFENRQANRGKLKTRKTGKTARKKAARKKRQEQSA